MSIKTSIGWTDMTLNPIKGRCKGGCWYCYYSGKRGFLNRFKQDPTISLNLDVFEKLPFHKKKIFLCSTHDLFGDWIPEHWRDLIFWHIELWRQHTFQILTKFPQNINRPMPDNVWLGVTIVGSKNYEKDYMKDLKKMKAIRNAKATIKFISFEPLIYDLPFDIMPLQIFDWIIVGKLTSYSKIYNPAKIWVEEIVEKARYFNIPIFLKNNLKEIWGEPLIQEFPNGR